MEVVPMTHPDIAQAVAAARRDDLLRAAESWRRGQVVTRVNHNGVYRSGRDRIAAWLKHQLRPRPVMVRPAPAPRCATGAAGSSR